MSKINATMLLARTTPEPFMASRNLFGCGLSARSKHLLHSPSGNNNAKTQQLNKVLRSDLRCFAWARNSIMSSRWQQLVMWHVTRHKRSTFDTRSPQNKDTKNRRKIQKFVVQKLWQGWQEFMTDMTVVTLLRTDRCASRHVTSHN